MIGSNWSKYISQASEGADLFLSYSFYDIVPRARKNILIFTVPWNIFRHVEMYDLLVADSEFTASGLKKLYSDKEIVVLYPFVDRHYKVGKKDKIVLTVGRFNQDLHRKEQLKMIRAFGEAGYKEWRLFVVGGASFSPEVKLFNMCVSEAGKYGDNIVVKSNMSFKNLIELYGRSSLYWHATGYNTKNPIMMEHCGMAVLQAMASGVIPLVVDKGEPPNLVGRPDQIWNTWHELEVTTLFWTENDKLREKRAKEMQNRVTQFDEKNFGDNIKEVFYG